jgi:ComF family protein
MSWFGCDSRRMPSRWSSLTGKIRRAALDFVYPPRCLLCGGESESASSVDECHVGLCSDCETKLRPSSANACRRCGVPLGPFTNSDDGCAVCRREHFAFDGVIRLGVYRDEMRSACLLAKNPNGALLSQTLADLWIDERRLLLADQILHAVIPVPEHWLKRLVRPHYAAEAIAERLSRRLKVRLATGILAKCRWTPKQAKSRPAQRRQQQKDAFRVVPNKSLNGQTILLVDDILTTGATADAAARALKRAGASRVVVAVLAVSPPVA